MKKKLLAGLLATALTVSVLAGCGSNAQDSAADSSAEVTETEEADAQDADAAATDEVHAGSSLHLTRHFQQLRLAIHNHQKQLPANPIPAQQELILLLPEFLHVE